MRKASKLATLLGLLLLFSLPLLSHTDEHRSQVLESVESERGLIKSVRVLKESGGRIDWSPNGEWIAMDRKQKDGYYDIFLIRADGTEERCLTDNTKGQLASGNNGQPAFDPSGRFLVFQSQKRAGVGRWGRDIASTPGLGMHSNLWLLDLDNSSFHQLTDTPNTDDSGVLHPHFSKDGTKLSWSECYKGDWRLMIADFSGRPLALSKVKSFKPCGNTFYENHGFSGDGQKLVFTSGNDKKLLTTTKIFQLNLESGEHRELASGQYNEVAHYTPRGQHIVWMTSRDNRNHGTDYWVMDPDGNNKRRVTDFNNPKLKSFRGKAIIAADHSFSPDGLRFAAYLQTDLIRQIGMTVIIELDPAKTDPL
jgi:Tol biopolymer transport system component